MVGFPGGSTPDMAQARVVVGWPTWPTAWASAWGQTVVVENKPGASGNVAADQVAKATDDHTLGVVINGNLTSAKLLNPKLPFDPAKDFSLISLLATAPLVLVTPPDQPTGAASSWPRRGRRRQVELRLGGHRLGGPPGHGMPEGGAGNTHAVHVPYNGNPAVLTAMIQGQIQMALVPPGLALPQVKAGKLHAIGLTGPPQHAGARTGAAGRPGVKMNPLEVWTALVGPATLSKPALERLARDVPALVREAERASACSPPAGMHRARRPRAWHCA
jgi:tripartite-type tricarboxylate transporter receptor subunit TctC